jgi:hypothetical protein
VCSKCLQKSFVILCANPASNLQFKSTISAPWKRAWFAEEWKTSNFTEEHLTTVAQALIRSPKKIYPEDMCRVNYSSYQCLLNFESVKIDSVPPSSFTNANRRWFWSEGRILRMVFWFIVMLKPTFLDAFCEQMKLRSILTAELIGITVYTGSTPIHMKSYRRN